MSAWFVSKAHIDVLVWACVYRDIGATLADGQDAWTHVGKTLWQENLLSLQARYPSEVELHAQYQEEIDGYVYRTPRTTDWTPSEILKFISCYDYQSCEHADWSNSDSKRWMNELSLALARERAKAEDMEYSNAPWGVPDCGGRHASYDVCECIDLPDVTDVDALDSWLRQDAP